MKSARFFGRISCAPTIAVGAGETCPLFTGTFYAPIQLPNKFGAHFLRHRHQSLVEASGMESIRGELQISL